jgi:hypothetical protein
MFTSRRNDSWNFKEHTATVPKWYKLGQKQGECACDGVAGNKIRSKRGHGKYLEILRHNILVRLQSRNKRMIYCRRSPPQSILL